MNRKIKHFIDLKEDKQRKTTDGKIEYMMVDNLKNISISLNVNQENISIRHIRKYTVSQQPYTKLGHMHYQI